MEIALKEGNLGFFSKDNLANLTGVEGLRSPEGSIFLSAGKNFFFSELKGIKGRPNQFLENILVQSLPLIGRNDEANLVVTRFMRNKLDILKEKTRMTDQVIQEFLDAGKPIPVNLGSMISKRLRPFVVDKEKELIQDIRRIKGGTQAPVKVRLPNGQTGTIPADKLEEALKLGAQQV
jgi:hypothetical protein